MLSFFQTQNFKAEIAAIRQTQVNATGRDCERTVIANLLRRSDIGRRNTILRQKLQHLIFLTTIVWSRLRERFKSIEKEFEIGGKMKR